MGEPTRPSERISRRLHAAPTEAINTTQIPEALTKALHDAGIETDRYLPLDAGTKYPPPKGWRKRPQLKEDDPELVAHLLRGGNYAVTGGRGLTLLDTDDPVTEAIAKKLPLTFTIKSGNGGFHRYYVSNLNVTIPLKDKTRPKKEEGVGEIRVTGAYVVGPDSTHPNGAKYEVFDARPLTFISEEKLREAFKQYISTSKSEDEEETEITPKPNTPNPEIDSIRIEDVLSTYGIKYHKEGDELRFANPEHGSDSGRNTAANPSKNVWRCHSCQSGGGPLELIALCEGLISCETIGKGSLRGKLHFDARDCAISRGLLKESPKPIEQKKEEETKLDDTKPDESEKKNHIKEALNNHLSKYTFKTADDIEALYIHKNGVYLPGEIFVKGLLETCFGTAASGGFVAEVIGHLKRRSYVPRSLFNKFEGEIPVENGLLDLHTGKVRNFDTSKVFTFKIHAKYDATKRSPAWEKFMQDVLPDELDRKAAQEYAGYTLLPKMPYHKLFFMVGNGRNGKGVFVRTIQSILGAESVSNIKIDQLNDTHRFASTLLFGMLMNVSSEPSIRYPLSTELLKQLSGEDWLDGEVKGKQNRVRFQPYAKHFILANRLPKVNDKSLGWWDRVGLIEWNQTFTDEKGNRVEDIEDTWLNDDDSRSGILTWMVEGLQRLRAQGKFTQSKTTKQAMIKFKKVSDPIAAFLEEECEYDPDFFEERIALFIAYKDYAHSLNSSVEGDRTFYATVRATPGVRDGDKKISGKTRHGFYGIRLRDHDENSPTELTLDTADTDDTLPTYSPKNEFLEKEEREGEENKKREYMKSVSAVTSVSEHTCTVCGEPTSILRLGLWYCRKHAIEAARQDHALGGGCT